jgi:phosphoserine phosphatase RsbU/P
MNPENENYSSSVLIVDDNPRNLQVLGGMLQKEGGMGIEFALNGESALDWLNRKQFDLVLLDIMMPGMDGFEVCSHMKNNPSTKGIPVIFITAKTDSESIVKGFQTGGVDYITKPFVPSELLARVQSQIQIRKAKEKILQYTREIEEHHRNIRDSIEYAKYIQRAVMRSSFSKSGFLPEYFILNLPKDIVSGDFYWFYEIDDLFILAVMDCTGHGVPGGFMSILGMTLLNEIVVRDKILRPDKILETLRDRIVFSLGQNYGKVRIRDGMEGSVITYNKKARRLSYSGSYNPMLLIHNNEMNVIRADRLPIGYYEKTGNFNMTSIQVEEGDMIYLYSDGYIDQFGGPEKRKVSSKAFMLHLKRYQHLPMTDQKNELINFLNQWKENMEQTDDILVVGIKL